MVSWISHFVIVFLFCSDDEFRLDYCNLWKALINGDVDGPTCKLTSQLFLRFPTSPFTHSSFVFIIIIIIFWK